MSKRHFEALAEMVREIVLDTEADRVTMARELANVCQRFNDRFDAGRFIAACEVRS